MKQFNEIRNPFTCLCSIVIDSLSEVTLADALLFGCFYVFLAVFGCFYVFLDLVGGGFSE